MGKKLKVLHLNASSSGGAFVVAQRLAEALNQRTDVEAEHLVYTGKPGNYHLYANTFFRKKYAFFLHALEKLDFLRFEKNSSVRFAFSHGLTGIRIANHPLVKAADIIHLHWINKGFISLSGLDELLQLNKPVFWTAHDQWPFTGGCYYSGNCDHYLQGCGNCPYLKSPQKDDLSAKVFQRKKNILSFAENLTLITPSQWLADKGIAAGTLGNKQIITIPNAIDTNLFHDNFREECRMKNRIPQDKFVILFAAVNLTDRRKGFAEFQALMELLKTRTEKPLHVVYIGDNKGMIPEPEGYTQEFTGFISDPARMSEWYRTADVYVTTSNDDNLPTTIMESLSSGTPVAAFGAGGIPEMIVDGNTGCLAPVYDVPTLGEKMINLMNLDSVSKTTMSQNCRNFAVTRYERSVVAARHAELYLQAVK